MNIFSIFYFQLLPYSFLEKDYITGETILTEGIEMQFLNELSKYFNFNYKVVNCNNTWGSNINGNWTGIIGQVLYQVKQSLRVCFI